MPAKDMLIWIDLEMTGLDAFNDVILEAAAVITTQDLTVVAQMEPITIHYNETVLAHMNEWANAHHTASGLLEKVRLSTTTVETAQHRILSFVQQYCVPGTALLCGNTIWQDRFFLRVHMPVLEQFFHYRVIDVSSIKELAHRWYPTHARYTKKDTHRALTDILESIDELAFYRTTIFKKPE